MDQVLKQRLIGAAVITALAAIFVPMLFDDPIDESGKSINELKIPEVPTKAQDVEIMPLPEKVGDVATAVPEEKPQEPVPAPAAVFEGDEEADVAVVRPQARITEKETAVAPTPARVVEPEPEAEDVVVQQLPAETVIKQPAKPKQIAPSVETAPKTATPAATAEPVAKPAVAAAESATTRWYLNAGTFSQKANAATLQESLKKQGFAASIKEVVGDKGTVYKVRIGPMLDKAKAQAVKSKLAQINVNSFVSGDE